MRAIDIASLALAASLMGATGAHAAATAPAPVVSGIVWSDLDGDGVRDRGEPAVSGVSVSLERRAGTRWTAVRRATTTAAGRYRIRLASGRQLRLRMIAPAGRTFSPPRRGNRRALDSDVSAGGVAALRRRSAVVDAGLLPAPAPLTQPVLPPGAPTPPAPSATPSAPSPGGTVRGTIWREVTVDGRRALSEPASMPATVQLWDAARTTVLASTTSAADGAYALALPSAGTSYRVRVVLPGGAAGYTQPDATAGDADDSDLLDAGPDAGYSPVLVADGADRSIDAGLRYLPPVTISGSAWRDANNDGAQANDEFGASATLELWTADRSVKLAQAASSNFVQGGGEYALAAPFGGIEVRVRLVPGGGFAAGKYRATSDATRDSDIIQWGPDDGWSAPIQLGTTGAPVTSVGVALAGLVNIGNRVWNDSDQDGWQDAGEPGIGGIAVEAWDVANTTMLDRKETNASGNYTVVVRGAGTYVLKVERPVLWVFSPLKVAGCAAALGASSDDQCDSDANNVGRISVTVASNLISTVEYDAGIHRLEFGGI